MISAKFNKPPKKPAETAKVAKPKKPPRKKRERLHYTRRFLWSGKGKLTVLEQIIIVLAQRSFYIAGFLFSGLVAAAEHLAANWTIMQDSLPWWGIVIVMGITGVIAAVNAVVSSRKDIKIARELPNDEQAGSE